MSSNKVSISIGFGKYTGPGVGAMTLLLPAKMPNKVRSVSIVNGAGAIREMGVAARDLTSITLVSAGDQGAYVAFTAPGGTAGNMAALACGIDSIIADCSPPPLQEGWWRGNTHTHSNQSDGDSAPEAAVGWYAVNGYDFVTLTDHDKVTSVQSNEILVLNGSEITAKNYPALHVAVSNIQTNIDKGDGDETQAVNAVLNNTPSTAMAILAHPGWYGAPIAKLAAITNLRFIEVFNACPTILSSESIWDQVLMARIASGNKAPLYGVAADDTHTFASNATPDKATPGHGWVMVRASAPAPTAAAVVSAMQQGDFYSSTGVTLEALTRTSTSVSLKAIADADKTYTVHVAVARASGLTTTIINGLDASYTLQSGDLYARLVAVSSTGTMAWTQPVIAP